MGTEVIRCESMKNQMLSVSGSCDAGGPHIYIFPFVNQHRLTALLFTWGWWGPLLRMAVPCPALQSPFCTDVLSLPPLSAGYLLFCEML